MNRGDDSQQFVLRLIGIDAAVDPRNNGLVMAELRPGIVEGVGTQLTVEETFQPCSEDDLVDTVVSWCDDAETQPILCIDAPLGWPHRLGPALVKHTAGEPIDIEANTLFRRITDGDIKERLGKTPLDVGADRIARATLHTLRRIDTIAEQTKRRRMIPLLRSELPSGSCSPRAAPRERPIYVIEVYPAGWCVSERIATSGYRRPAERSRREEILDEALGAAITPYPNGGGISPGYTITLKADRDRFTRRADDLDALLCVMAGVDAVLGRAPDIDIALGSNGRGVFEREGWAWCKSPRS